MLLALSLSNIRRQRTDGVPYESLAGEQDGVRQFFALSQAVLTYPEQHRQPT
jgi:hypothetical protein